MQEQEPEPLFNNTSTNEVIAQAKAETLAAFARNLFEDCNHSVVASLKTTIPWEEEMAKQIDRSQKAVAKAGAQQKKTISTRPRNYKDPLELLTIVIDKWTADWRNKFCFATWDYLLKLHIHDDLIKLEGYNETLGLFQQIWGTNILQNVKSGAIYSLLYLNNSGSFFKKVKTRDAAIILKGKNGMYFPEDIVRTVVEWLKILENTITLRRRRVDYPAIRTKMKRYAVKVMKELAATGSMSANAAVKQKLFTSLVARKEAVLQKKSANMLGVFKLHHKLLSQMNPFDEKETKKNSTLFHASQIGPEMFIAVSKINEVT